LASGQQVIKTRYETDLASGAHVEGKIVQMYALGDEVCAITEYRAQHQHTGHALTIFVREAGGNPNALRQLGASRGIFASSS
jgi:hypothetical protein